MNKKVKENSRCITQRVVHEMVGIIEGYIERGELTVNSFLSDPTAWMDRAVVYATFYYPLIISSIRNKYLPDNDSIDREIKRMTENREYELENREQIKLSEIPF